MMDTNEIDLVSLVDDIIQGCLAKKLPPYPKPIAEALSRVFCSGTSAATHAVMMVQMTALVRERIEFLAAHEQAVN